MPFMLITGWEGGGSRSEGRRGRTRERGIGGEEGLEIKGRKRRKEREGN